MTSAAASAAGAEPVYLVDTDVLSELRKGPRANAGVSAFFREAGAAGRPVFLSVVTLGELRQGIESIRARGDRTQADRLERWLADLLLRYDDCILPLDADIAQVWGRLRARDPANPLDKQIAATALVHDLQVVTGNVRHFRPTGARVLDPFDR